MGIGPNERPAGGSPRCHSMGLYSSQWPTVHASAIRSVVGERKTAFGIIRVGAGRSRTGCAGSSLRLYFQCMRTLLRWMIQEQLQRFADLDAELIADFTRTVKRRRGYTGPTISRQTLIHYYRVLIGLHRHRGTVLDALQVDPFPGLSARGATARTPERKPEPYTPDVVAIPLIQGAIELLNATAFRTLAVRESCLQTYQRLRPPTWTDAARAARYFGPIRDHHRYTARTVSIRFLLVAIDASSTYSTVPASWSFLIWSVRA